MNITIWDTAGQERFQAVCRTFYRRADCILLCYDASGSERAFGNCERWRQEIETYGSNHVVVMLVGCKSDKGKRHQLNVKSIIEQPEWQKFNAIHYECSAKTGDNVRNVFLAAAELVLMTRPNIEFKEKHDIIHVRSLQREAAKKETKCC
eukprot:UN07934